jgi:hypothetical protein
MASVTHRERLERQRRRSADREIARAERFEHIPVPSVSWLPKPSFVLGLASLIDIPGVMLRTNWARLRPGIDGVILGRDFGAIAADLRLATETISADQQRLFDIDEF